MADTTKETYTLKLVAGFTDGDERTISLDNPKNNLTAEQIRAIDPLAAKAIIGDKYGAPFQTFKDAGYQRSVVTTLDLEAQP